MQAAIREFHGNVQEVLGMRPTLIYGAVILTAIASSAIADDAVDKVIEPGAFKGKILKSVVGDSHIWHVARAGSSPGKPALYARWCKPILRPPHLSCTGPWKLLQFPDDVDQSLCRRDPLRRHARRR